MCSIHVQNVCCAAVPQNSSLLRQTVNKAASDIALNEDFCWESRGQDDVERKNVVQKKLQKMQKVKTYGGF